MFIFKITDLFHTSILSIHHVYHLQKILKQIFDEQTNTAHIIKNLKLDIQSLVSFLVKNFLIWKSDHTFRFNSISTYETDKNNISKWVEFFNNYIWIDRVFELNMTENAQWMKSELNLNLVRLSVSFFFVMNIESWTNH